MQIEIDIEAGLLGEVEAETEIEEFLHLYYETLRATGESDEITFEILQELYWLTDELKAPFAKLLEDFKEIYPRDISHEVETLKPRLDKLGELAP